MEEKDKTNERMKETVECKERKKKMNRNEGQQNVKACSR
jgi:hypothetical protein